MTHAVTIDILTLLGAAGVAAALIVLLRPLLQRYALARPNARSSHRVPTPQGGGIAVMAAATVAVAAAGLLAPHGFAEPSRLSVVFVAAAALALVGAIDDIRPLEAWPRLLLQAVAVAVVIIVLPAGLRVIPLLPWWVERALMGLAVLWLVNLVNFMDGIDWITVVEIVPITAALAVFGWRGALPPEATATALALCGALIGFAPFNRPVAKLFLGDVGSLPIGLLLGWLLIVLAEHHLAAALLLPLYYVADATITLLRRLLRGERITQAHRSHFYQQAVDGGLGVYQVVGRILAVNIVLAVLAASTLNATPGMQLLAFASGAALVAALLAGFSRAKVR
jgi:UDP-N-acetylmuramyl pentapeptide phosphotransferase/UDP-N-acetylglucosamine-1-phosphate transferase